MLFKHVAEFIMKRNFFSILFTAAIIFFFFTMNSNTGIKTINNSDNSNEWIEEAIANNHFKHYEYKHFSNIQEISSGGFGKVCRANWKNSDQYLTLKSFSKPDNVTVKEIVHEVTEIYDVYFDLFLLYFLFNL